MQRDKSEAKCANCFKFGHTAAECRQPKTEKRKCFICLQEGHQARNCPDKDKNKLAHARMLDQNSKTGFSVDADGFVPVQRRKPEPRKATLAEFVIQPKSAFSRFSQFIGDEEDIARPVLKSRCRCLKAARVSLSYHVISLPSLPLGLRPKA